MLKQKPRNFSFSTRARSLEKSVKPTSAVAAARADKANRTYIHGQATRELQEPTIKDGEKNPRAREKNNGCNVHFLLSLYLGSLAYSNLDRLEARLRCYYCTTSYTCEKRNNAHKARYVRSVYISVTILLKGKPG